MTVRAKAGIAALVLLLVAGGGVALYLSASGAPVLTSGGASVPTTRVVKGAIEMTVHTKGDLRASKSVMIQAPPVAGGLLRIVTMAETGAAVKTGDVVVEFDPTEQQYNLEQARSQVEEADQQLVKLQADRDAQIAQDRVDLLIAQFDVRRAEMDARPDKDLLARADFEKRQLSLDEVRKRLDQVQQSIKARAETSRASLAVAQEARTKAKFAADRAQMNIDGLVIKATMDGYVVARENRDASGGFFYSGMSLPEYRAGDNVFPGRPLADVFDLTQMEIRGKINEQQRNNVSVGQAATVESPTLPGAKLTAKVTAVSGLAQSSMFSMSGPLRDFDVTLKLDAANDALRPGTTVQLVLAGTRVDNVLHVPRQAIFERNGKPVVYVRAGDRFDAREVKPIQRTETRIAIEGLPEGTEIALVNPDAATKAASKTPAASPTGVAK
jgi:HlyD family secretion protein